MNTAHAALRERLAEITRATAMNEAIRGTARQQPTRAELDAMAFRQRLHRDGISAGQLCANCVESLATHRGRVDTSGALYPICDGCELPDTEALGE